MPDYRTDRRHLPGHGAGERAEILGLRAVGLQLLAPGHERPDVLHDAGEPSQLCDRQLHVTLMTGIGYIRMEEVGGIPRLPRTPGVIVYAPLGETPVDPDVVLFAGRPGRVMLLQEAALRAGVGAGVPLLARPTCMALPAALAKGAVASTACIGNRVYTDVGEDELWVVMPGKDLSRVADELRAITDANNTLSEYHRDRRRTLATE